MLLAVGFIFGDSLQRKSCSGNLAQVRSLYTAPSVCDALADLWRYAEGLREEVSKKYA